MDTYNAFSLTGIAAALAGALYAHFIGFIDPGSFRSDESVTALCMVVLGGMGSMPGSVIAATLLTVIPEMLRGLDKYRMFIYGLLLILMMLGKTVNWETTKIGRLLMRCKPAQDRGPEKEGT